MCGGRAGHGDVLTEGPLVRSPSFYRAHRWPMSTVTGGLCERAHRIRLNSQVLRTVRKLLVHVLPEAQIAPWLSELVDGRYR